MFANYFLPFIFLQFFLISIQSTNLQNEWQSTKLSSPLKTAELKFMQKLFEKKQFLMKNNNSVFGYEPKILKNKGHNNCINDENEEEFVLEFQINGLSTNEKLIDAKLLLFLPETQNHQKFGTFYNKHKYRHNSIFKHHKISKQQKLFKLKEINDIIELFVYSENNCNKIEKLILQKIQSVEDENNLNLNNWFIYNVNKIIERNLKENKLSLIIRVEKPKKYTKILNKEEISNFAYSHGPFLVIYTEDNEIDEELNDNKNKRIKREIFQSTDDNLQIKEHMNLVRRQAEYFAYGMALPQEPLPLDNDLQKPIKNIPNEFALRRRKMKNRRKNKQKLSRKISFDANDPMLGFGTNKSPWERSIKENKFGNSLNDFKELEDNERDVMMINKNEKNDEEINMGIKGGGSIKKCSRHNLTIDIRELGLNERIIAPKTFETGYCAGSCEYPLDKSLRPSNHAIFQSLIVKLQSITNNNITTKIEKTPSVCCAPDKFDSLTMLYFNENGNLVLKNFPRMIVLKCGCI